MHPLPSELLGPAAWYADSLMLLTGLLIATSLIGRGLAGCLPWRFRALGQAFFGPVLGLAALVLVAILLGWVGPGYRRPVCLMSLLLLVALGVRRERSVRALLVHAGLLAVFVAVASFGTLAVIWQFGAFNPYNDTFTYLMHSQWLQSHGFGEPAIRNGYSPAFSQVVCYQLTGLRMGASFFFGFVQALTGSAWSYQVWPLVIALPVAALGWSLAGVVYWLCHRRVLALASGCLIGLTLNGFLYGTAHGYLPQTYGLAFLCAALLLVGIAVTVAACATGLRRVLLATLPAALLCAVTVHTYSEVAPFLVATVVVSYLCAAAANPRAWRHLAVSCVVLAVLTGLLVNFELVRTVKAIRGQTNVVVGEAVPWSVLEFIGHGVGVRAGIDDGQNYLLPVDCWKFGVVGLIVLGVWGGWCGLRHRRSCWLVLPHLILLGFCALAFLHFRYRVPAPFAQGLGQSWNQFKLSNWAAPSLYVILVAGLAGLAGSRKKISPRSLGALLLVLLLGGAGAAAIWQLNDQRTQALRTDTGLAQAPLRAFFQIRDWAGSLDPDQPLYLQSGPRKIGCRQMLMYALSDRKLAGDWTDDAWVKHWLPSDQRQLPLAECEWLVTAGGVSLAGTKTAGNLQLCLRPKTSFDLVHSEGGYPRETDSAGWWHWTAQSLRFEYQVVGELPRQVVVAFRCWPISEGRPVTVRVAAHPPQLVRMAAGEKMYQLAPGAISNRTVRIDFNCELPPVQLSQGDTRLASYLIKNLQLLPVE